MWNALAYVESWYEGNLRMSYVVSSLSGTPYTAAVELIQPTAFWTALASALGTSVLNL